jgi:hypothetical protein
MTNQAALVGLLDENPQPSSASSYRSAWSRNAPA